MEDVKTILLDTNFLLIPGQFGVDIFSELERICDFRYELCVLDASVRELNGIVASTSASAKDRRAAALGLQLIKANGVRVLQAERKVFKSTDKAIIDFAVAGSKSVVVATQDSGLKKRLAAKGVGIIVLRQKRHLVFQ